jgi:hypothetical protein
MIVYHGTTAQNALKIEKVGFRPQKPSRKVWFAESKHYALRRAKSKASIAHDRPVVLSCDIDLSQMRHRLGSQQVFHQNGIVAINATIPASVLRSYPIRKVGSPPEALAAWVNRLLGFKPHEGVSRRHPGINRLSQWIVNRLTYGGCSKINTQELLQKAQQWLPEYFVEGTQINYENLRVQRRGKTVEVEMEAAPSEEIDTREQEALDCLIAQNPKRRIRGLKLLTELKDPDLFDWCMMFFDDDSTDVQVAVLRTMLHCDDVDTEIILPLAECDEKRLRAAAIAVLAKHSEEDAPHWFEWGLTDNSVCVRLETAALLPQLEPREHRYIFELALHDPNPRVRHIARKLTVGKGFKVLR